jgi:hypothetical protein
MVTVTLPDDSGFRAIPSTAERSPRPWAIPQPKAAIAIPNPAAVTHAMKNSNAFVSIDEFTSFELISYWASSGYPLKTLKNEY